MKKSALFGFNGDPMCFIHVLLNALDMKDKGETVCIVVEGSATKLIDDLSKKDNPLHTLWEKAKAQDLVAGVCKACSQKMGTIEAARSQGLALLDDMAGHPSMARYRQEGYDLITF